MEKDGVISQDEHRAHEKDVQAFTDETIKHLDETLAHKEKEIMQV
jgi:ribosome recycling factor